MTAHDPKPERTLIADTLLDARHAKSWSLRQAEKESGVSNGYISQVEKGTVRPSPDVLQKLASAYDVPYRLLMERAGYIKPANDDPNANRVPAFVFNAAEVFNQEDWDMAQRFFEQLHDLKRRRSE